MLEDHQEGAQEELWAGQLQTGRDRIKRNVRTGVGEGRSNYRVPVNEGTVPVYRLSVIQSGTEELSVAWTRMAGEEDAVVGVNDNVNRGIFEKGARILSGAGHRIMAVSYSTHRVLLLPIPLPHEYIPRCLPGEGTRAI